MPTEPTVEITISVRIGDQTKTFTATASTDDANRHRVARGVLSGLESDAADWLVDERLSSQRRGGPNGSYAPSLSRRHGHT